MDILVVGSGGREHALAWKIKQSNRVDKLYLAPGNGGTCQQAINVGIGPMDFQGLGDFCQEEHIDLVVVGPEEPLAAGLVDYLKARGVRVFGPSKACARLEASKDFTKEFLIRHSIPTAQSFTCQDFEEALKIIRDKDYPIVIKADGLYKGKGVVIAENYSQAEKALEDMLVRGLYGPSGSKVIIEEYLTGHEASLICLVSNNRLIPMESARDYKRALDGDQGPNTGGVGVFSPAMAMGPGLRANIAELLQAIEEGLKKDSFEFYGILFIGLMIENDLAKVLEFNVRFGDPECQVLMPRLESDLVDLMDKCLDQTLGEADLKWSSKSCVGVVMYSQGYPSAYKTGYPIKDIPDLGPDQVLFHNASLVTDGGLVSDGGRVLTAVGLGDDLQGARDQAYDLADRIVAENLTYRKDIADI